MTWALAYVLRERPRIRPRPIRGQRVHVRGGDGSDTQVQAIPFSHGVCQSGHGRGTGSRRDGPILMNREVYGKGVMRPKRPSSRLSHWPCAESWRWKGQGEGAVLKFHVESVDETGAVTRTTFSLENRLHVSVDIFWR